MQSASFVAEPSLYQAFVLKGLGAEIEKERQAKSGRGQIVERLSFVVGVQG